MTKVWQTEGARRKAELRHGGSLLAAGVFSEPRTISPSWLELEKNIREVLNFRIGSLGTERIYGKNLMSFVSVPFSYILTDTNTDLASCLNSVLNASRPFQLGFGPGSVFPRGCKTSNFAKVRFQL